MLKKYLLDRAKHYRSAESSIPTSLEGKDARFVWNNLKAMFIAKQENNFDSPIAIYLTTLGDGHFYYSEGVFFERLVERSFWHLEDTCEIVLQLAMDDGITVNRLENQNFFVLDGCNLFGYNSKIVYEFSFTPFDR